MLNTLCQTITIRITPYDTCYNQLKDQICDYYMGIILLRYYSFYCKKDEKSLIVSPFHLSRHNLCVYIFFNRFSNVILYKYFNLSPRLVYCVIKA